MIIRHDWRSYSPIQVAHLFVVCQTARDDGLVYKYEGRAQYKQNVPYVRGTRTLVNREYWLKAMEDGLIERRIEMMDCQLTAKGQEFMQVFSILERNNRPMRGYDPNLVRVR